MLTTNRNFFLVLLLSIVTFGIYPLYLVHCFSKETNTACAADGKSTTGFSVSSSFPSSLSVSMVSYGR